MLPEVLASLRAKKTPLTDRLVARITAAVPEYAASDPHELRRNIDALIDDVLAFLEAGDRSAYTERLAALSAARIAQGFSPEDVLQALLVAAPVLRDTLREDGPADPAMAQAFDVVEAAVHELAITAGSLYVDHVARRMKAKNDELNRQNLRLLAQEELLSIEVSGMARALGNAQEFLRCTIDSLPCGLLVVDARTRRISLYSSRAEQILGIPAEEALGRDVVAALGPLSGIDIQSIVNTVLRLGRLPLVRLSLTRDDGRVRHVSVRAQRVFDPSGEPKATVCAFDDVTREERLADSIARFLPRATAERVMAEGGELPRERRAIGVVVAELRPFVKLAEALSPESLHEALDAFVRAAIEAATAHGGFVDSVAQGRAELLFTSRASAEEAAEAAVLAARELTRRLVAASAERTLRGEPRFAFGAGVDAGEALLAPIGDEARTELVAVGDAVCRAALLAELAGEDQVLVGEAAATLGAAAGELRRVGRRAARGRRSPLEVFELLRDEDEG
jgi:PAS domain S-box-containing protein